LSEITATKAEFALALTSAGLDVVPYFPARVTPPIVIMQAGTPYLTNATVGHEFNLMLELQCVAMTADNEMATEALDQLIEDVVNALPEYAVLKSVGQPFALDVNNAQYLTATVQTELALTL
jgi:hypothetical protein